MPRPSPALFAVAALSVTQLIGWGATFWLPAVAGSLIAADFGLPLPVIMAGPTAMLVMMALISWPLRTLFDRHGARMIMVVGSPIGALGLLALGAANGPISYFLAWIIIGIAGACMLTTAAQIALTEVAGNHAKKALSFLVLAGGLTSTITWPITSILMNEWGWRATTLFYAVLLLVVCTPLHWKALASHRNKTEKAESAKSATINRAKFMLLATSFAANGFFTWGFALTIIILFEARGLDHAHAITAAAFIGIAQWAGRMVEVVAGNRVSGLLISIAGAALFPFSFIILLQADGVAGAILFATLYGVASGVTAVARATLPLELFPPAAYARASSQMAVPLNLAFATAPPLFTLIMTSASPEAALWTALLISIFAFSCLLGLALMKRADFETAETNVPLPPPLQ